MKKELTIGLLAVALTMGMVSTATAQSNQETNVTVGISGVTQLDVRPSTLSYTDSGDVGSALEPGESRTESDDGFRHIEVENIGSERIGSIYAQASMNTEQPFGTFTSGSSDPQHNTGNFVTISLDGANNASYSFGGELSDVQSMHYLNRVEYFEENPPTYIQTVPTGDNLFGSGDSVQSVDVGRFRVGAADYFFVVYETDAGTNPYELVIGTAPHTPTVRGTTDFTADDSDTAVLNMGDGSTGPSDIYQIQNKDLVSFNTSDGNYTGQSLLDTSAKASLSSELETNISATTRSYNLYVKTTDPGYITRTKFNVEQESPGGYDSETSTSSSNYQISAETGGAQEYILQASGSTPSEALQPGENFPINFGVQVPSGVDQNAINTGTVTVVSNTYTG